MQMIQTANQVLILIPYYGNFRVIWTDGRHAGTTRTRAGTDTGGQMVNGYTFIVRGRAGSERLDRPCRTPS